MRWAILDSTNTVTQMFDSDPTGQVSLTDGYSIIATNLNHIGPGWAVDTNGNWSQNSSPIIDGGTV
jgi:hypothetical protein